MIYLPERETIFYRYVFVFSPGRGPLLTGFFALGVISLILLINPHSSHAGLNKDLNNSSNLARKGIGFVVPTFTAAAYNNAFYVFFEKYSKAPSGLNITDNLNLLTSHLDVPKSPIRDADAASSRAIQYFVKHTALLLPNYNVDVLTDMDVDKGLVFDNGLLNINNTNKYEALVLGHNEYVTQREYDNIKHFVANGGLLILLDSNTFYAEVGYDNFTNTITLIKGHAWAFNGKSAWKSVAERWKDETSTWIGSNTLCYSCQTTFVNNPFGYVHREEQYITNPNAKLLLNYNISAIFNNGNYRNVTFIHSFSSGVYELNYGLGKVISFSVYTDDLIFNRKFIAFFDKMLLNNL